MAAANTHSLVSAGDRLVGGSPGAPAVPKLMHHIWIGDAVPAELLSYRETWLAAHPHWRHIMWDEAAILALGLRNRNLWDAAKDIAPGHELQFRVDVARYEIMWRFGGLYVDMDFECRRNVDCLIRDVRCAAVWEETGTWIANGLLAAVPMHELFALLIDRLPDNCDRHAWTGVRPNRISGPQFLTPIVLQEFHVGEIKLFPQEWFFPYAYDELHRKGEDAPTAYAIHHWHNQRRLHDAV